MKLEDIGFYTMSDARADIASASSPLSRCEIVLTSRCNFRCPYCRSVGGEDAPYEEVEATIRAWADDGLSSIRFSGGEPTLYPSLAGLCRLSRDLGIKNIAVSTNGSADRALYDELLACGVNDFSVSLDACCAEDGDKMAGGIKGAFDRITETISYLSGQTYVTVGVVLTDDNILRMNDIISFADSLGISDIRVIPAAQNGDRFGAVDIDKRLLDKHKILRYRVSNLINSRPVRGLRADDSHKCGLVLDDMAVNHNKHYPCIIYMRESGAPIGEVGSSMREARRKWYEKHDTHADPICSKNCLDVCVDYNNRFEEAKQ